MGVMGLCRNTSATKQVVRRNRYVGGNPICVYNSFLLVRNSSRPVRRCLTNLPSHHLGRPPSLLLPPSLTPPSTPVSKDRASLRARASPSSRFRFRSLRPSVHALPPPLRTRVISCGTSPPRGPPVRRRRARSTDPRSSAPPLSALREYFRPPPTLDRPLYLRVRDTTQDTYESRCCDNTIVDTV